MSYSQNLKTETVERVYKWYDSNTGGSGTQLPSDVVLDKPLFTSSTYTDITKFGTFVIEKGLYGKYIWCQMTVKAKGYVDNSIASCIGQVTHDKVVVTPNWAGTSNTIKVASTVSVSDSEFSVAYNPSTFQTGDNTSASNDKLQTTYDVTVTRSYKWVVLDSNTATDDQVKNATGFSTSASANVPSSAVGKYIYCYVSYSISDTNNYELDHSYNIKKYTNKVQSTSLTITLSQWGYVDNADKVAYGVHDKVYVTLESATDGITGYSASDLTTMFTNYTATWKSRDASNNETTLTGGAIETIDGKKALTFTVPSGGNFVDKTLSVSVTASNTAYNASGSTGTSYSPSIKKATIVITTPTIPSNLVYGDGQSICNAITTNDNDITSNTVGLYYSIDTELTDKNYTTGKTTIPTNTGINAYNGSNQITHTLYVYYKGDADHNPTSTSKTFTVARQSKTITLKDTTNGSVDFASGNSKTVTYGDSAKFSYTINQSGSNESSSVTVKSSASNLSGVNTSGSTSTVNGNTATELNLGNVTAYSTTNNTVTITSAQSNNFTSATATIVIKSEKRTLTISNATISTTSPKYDNEVSVTKGEGSTYGNGDNETLVFGTTYQWYSNTSASTTGGTLLSGETGSTYTPTADDADKGLFIYCVVTYTLKTGGSNKGGNYTLSRTSQTLSTTTAVAKRTMKLTLGLSGNLQYGQVLTSNATVTDNG